MRALAREGEGGDGGGGGWQPERERVQSRVVECASEDRVHMEMEARTLSVEARATSGAREILTHSSYRIPQSIPSVLYLNELSET